MASGALRGSASFTFTNVTGMTSPFLLAVPLTLVSHLEVAQPEERWVWESMDRSGRTVVAVESAKVDVLAVIRFDDQPDRLRSFLRLALSGSLANLSYKPTAAANAFSVAIAAVSGRTSVQIRPDRARGGLGEWEAQIRLVMAASDLGKLI